jgi:hypothetical protein
MIKEPVTTQLIEFLNSVAAIDPLFMIGLVNARVVCNEQIAKHPTIQAGTGLEFQAAKNNYIRKSAEGFQPQQYVCGLLGLLNGFCGMYDEGEFKGWGPITAVLDDSASTICFRHTEVK